MKRGKIIKIVAVIIVIIVVAVAPLIYWNKYVRDFGYSYHGVMATIEYNDLKEPITESEGRDVFSKYYGAVNNSHLGKNGGFSITLYPEEVNATEDEDGSINVDIIWKNDENIVVNLRWDSHNEDNYKNDKNNLTPYVDYIIEIFENEFDEEPDNISYEKIIIEHRIRDGALIDANMEIVDL